MSTESREPSEEELRAAYEAELKQLRVEHVLLDHVAALANLGMRRTGLAPGTETERDPGQVRLAIESLRALLPVLEQAAPSQVPAIRDAVSQLQMAYVRIAPDAGAADPSAAPQAGGTEPPAPGGAEPSAPGGAEPPAPGGAEPSAPGGAEPPAPGGAESPAPGGAEPPSQEPPKPGEPGPAQRSGRLWVPGQ